MGQADAREELAAQLMRWLAIDSVTPGEREFLEHLEATFTERGYVCTRQPVAPDRWNLLAMPGGERPARLLYSTHVDTVPPFLAPRREDDTIYGRGACDTKGGLVAMLEAARRLDAPGVGFLLVVGEEVDHLGAKAARELELAPERVILCEPTVNRVVAAQKGMIKLDVAAEGIAAHSAYPARGDSALHRMLDALHAVMHAAWPTDEVLGPTTINVGQLEGGVAANVFAPTAQASVLLRTVAPTGEYLPALEELCGPHRVELEVVAENDPVFFDPPDGEATCTVAFNTDATYLSELGPVWLVGPGDIEVAHTDHEHIELGELLEGVALYERLGRIALEASG